MEHLDKKGKKLEGVETYYIYLNHVKLGLTCKNFFRIMTEEGLPDYPDEPIEDYSNWNDELPLGLQFGRFTDYTNYDEL